jgi:hypothetical protein
MYPPTHFLAGLSIGAVGNKLGYFDIRETWALPFISMLVDIDHYLYFILKHKKFSFFEAWQSALSKREEGQRTVVHHVLGFFIFTTVLVVLWFIDQKWSLLLGLGYYSHILLDYLPIESKHVSFEIFKLKFCLSYQEILCFFIFLSFSIYLLYI